MSQRKAQLVGAINAAVMVQAAYGHGAYVATHLGAPFPPNGANPLKVPLVEAVIALMLVLTIFLTTIDPRVPAHSAAMATGFSPTARV